MPNLHRTTGICYYANVCENTDHKWQMAILSRAYISRVRSGSRWLEGDFTRTSFFGDVGMLLLLAGELLSAYRPGMSNAPKATSPFAVDTKAIRAVMRRPYSSYYHVEIPLPTRNFHYVRK